MRLILQRVSRAEVRVDGETVGEIGRGLLVLAGVERGDGSEQAVKAAVKLTGLRVFDDREGKMNLNLAQVGGSVLLVSQFTLAGSLDRGRRPSFERAAAPELAAPLIERLAGELEQRSVPVACGRFGARMEVESVNDGPVTFVLDL
ncbi:MAG: D-aminoacyl-tRNA deacylase [Thermoanaerobaculia bacterium]